MLTSRKITVPTAVLAVVLAIVLFEFKFTGSGSIVEIDYVGGSSEPNVTCAKTPPSLEITFRWKRHPAKEVNYHKDPNTQIHATAIIDSCRNLHRP